MASWHEPPRSRPRTLEGLGEFVVLLVVFFAALSLVCWLHGWPLP